MNNIKETLFIGDPKVTQYQKTIVVIGILLVLFSGFVAIITNNQYYKYFPLIIFVFFLVILLLYSRVYSVSCDCEKFYVYNLFTKKTIEKDKFLEIRKVIFIDFLQLVVFKDDKLLIFKTSNNYFKNIFKSQDIIANELTNEIKKFINL